MTTTTTFKGMDPDAKSSSRVLRPPGGGSNISFGSEEEKPAVRKDKMASSIFAEPDDPHAHRRNNPPGGKPTGVLCGESSAPLRRCAPQAGNQNNSPLDEPSSAQRAQMMQRPVQSRRNRPDHREKDLRQEPHQAAGILQEESPPSSWAEQCPPPVPSIQSHVHKVSLSTVPGSALPLQSTMTKPSTVWEVDSDPSLFFLCRYFVNTGLNPVCQQCSLVSCLFVFLFISP
uniref:Jupiter microtubule associated homolog 1a n=1 Tax=Astyanax mexicanus TaxID=7994 RepID=A0A8B9LRM0_ASTMX